MRSHSTLTVAFSETLPAGRYGLDFTSVATSNAYSFRSAGFAQVVADLRLDIGGPSDTDVAFDWSVEDGFGFDDDSSPGLVDYYEPDGALEIVRSAYPVDFEAEDSDPCDSTRSRASARSASTSSGTSRRSRTSRSGPRSWPRS